MGPKVANLEEIFICVAFVGTLECFDCFEIWLCNVCCIAARQLIDSDMHNYILHSSLFVGDDAVVAPCFDKASRGSSLPLA